MMMDYVMSTTLIKDSPLNVPELRSRISRYVSVADAISCVRVSKDWSIDFAASIWFAVDFKTHGSFELLSATVIAKHGHLIRAIRHLSTQGQLDALLHPNICNVRVLYFSCTAVTRYHISCMDIVRNNNKSLETLSVQMISKEPFHRMISLDAVLPHSSNSRLTCIKLRNVCISRASFVALLKGCPLLTNVSILWNTNLLSGPSLDTFQHTGVVMLGANLNVVFKPDPDCDMSALGFSLLTHFPNLEEWTLFSVGPTLIVPIERITAEKRLCCPKVSQICTLTTPSHLLDLLLSKVFRNLTSVTFAYEQLSSNIVLALLLHKTTLSVISATRSGESEYIERDDISVERDPFQTSGQAIQLLLRCCKDLTICDLRRHEMDMDIVEEGEWVCKGLLELSVRIRGLDTPEKIDRTMRLWLEGTKNGRHFKQVEANNPSVEERVARHLLTFEHLENVWLGTQIHYIV